MNKTPVSRYNTRDIPCADRLSSFQELAASVYDAYAIGDEASFMVETFGYLVKDVMFNDFKCSHTRFHRSTRHLQGRDTDFLVLHAQLSGEELLQMEHGVIRLLPGNIYLRDWSYPFHSQVADTMHIKSVLIPRHHLTFSNLFSVHNPIMSWSMSWPEGELLWAAWSQVFDQLSQADVASAALLAQGFLGMLNGIAMVDGRHHTTGDSKLRAMEQYLQTQLRGNISVEELCTRFHLSRATLFRLFKAHGGLQHYIDRKRLERCYMELRSSDPSCVVIREVAAGWGYLNASSFNRKFRTFFGVSPSSVLGTGYVEEKVAQTRQKGTRKAHHYNKFQHWLEEASGLNETDSAESQSIPR